MIFKIIRDVKNEELGKEFFMWEKDSNRNACRHCVSAFSTFRRRHHCRMCGGLFCEACTVTNVTIQGATQDRVCCGCFKQETPGARVRSSIESKLSSNAISLNEKIFNLNILNLEYGSPYEPGSAGTPVTGAAPKNGYFEFINKSGSFCAIKLLSGGSGNEFDTVWEIARPSYRSVPPNELVNVQFSTDGSESVCLELFVLYGNSNVIPGDISSVKYDTRSSSDISPCAAVENFWQFAVFRIDASSKNVLLKFKGDGVVEIRLGSSLERNGFFSKLTGSSGKETSTLDFSSNIASSALVRVV